MAKINHVAFSCNDHYISHASVSLVSLLENNKDCFFGIHIAHSGISGDNERVIEKICRAYGNASAGFHKVDAGMFSGMDSSIDYITRETFYRYLLPEILPEADVVLYLDCDTIINADISLVFAENLDGYFCAGVKDVHVEKEHYAKTIGINTLYINAGVILFNLKMMRETDAMKQLFSTTLRNMNVFRYQDQDVINVVFSGKIKELDFSYNFKRKHLNLFSTNLKNARIVHYVGPNKPWVKKSRNAMKRLYYKYEDILRNLMREDASRHAINDKKGNQVSC